MNKIEFDYYDADEFDKYLSTLPPKDVAKLLGMIELIKQLGMLTAIKQKWVKKIDDNLYEIRSKQSSNIQRAIYFHFVKNKYVITHGFTKKQQKTPKKEIERGKRLRDDYLGGHKHG